MTVGELLQRMSSKEITEWIAFYEMEPWGCEIDDQRSGIIASTFANGFRDKRKRKKPFQVSDFMPDRGPKKPVKKSWQSMLALVEVMNAALGGDDLRTQQSR